MALYRRDRSPYWWAAYTAPALDADGCAVILRREHGRAVVATHRQQRSTVCLIRGQTARARELLVRWTAEANEIIADPDTFNERVRARASRRSLTVDDLRKRWLEVAANKKSFDDDVRRFVTLVDILGAATFIADLKAPDIDRLKQSLLAKKTRRGKANEPSTVNRHLALLRAALRRVEDEGYRNSLPRSAFELLPEHNRRTRVVTPDELERLLARAPSSSIRIAVLLAYHCGLRRGEISALRRDQVDLAHREIQLEADQTKPGRARGLPIPPALADELEALFKALPRDERVCPIQPSSISSSFTRMAKPLNPKDLAKSKKLTLHSLRHTALTNLRRAGADLFVLQRVAGHSTIAMVERYQHVEDADVRAAFERVDNGRTKTSTSRKGRKKQGQKR